MYRCKRGAASFYMVAFSTLILLVIVMGFATLVVSQMERSSDEDLSQSAYDAAMAGVEDAKLAYEKYLQCKKDTNYDPTMCSDIISYVKDGDCAAVQKILNRPSDDGVVPINEGGTNNNLQQAYTCVKLKVDLDQQVKSVEAYKPTVFKPQFRDANAMNDLNAIEVEWDGSSTISVAIVQMPTGGMNVSDFARVEGSATNRAMVYLQPGGSISAIGKENVANSNNKGSEKQPFPIDCPSGGTCSVKIELPGVYPSGNRGDFEVVVSKPEPGVSPFTEVGIKYYKGSEAAVITNQFRVDSTGRANDIFRRVLATVEVDAPTIGVMGPLEVLDGKDLK